MLIYQPVDNVNPPFAAIHRALTRDESITRHYKNLGNKFQSWTRPSELVRVDARLIEARERLTSMMLLSSNWDGYGSEPPNSTSRLTADRILVLLRKYVMSPSRLVTSAEGGVGIIFSEGARYADIECLNSGEVLTATYAGKETPVIQEIGSTDVELTAAIERIRGHFAA